MNIILRHIKKEDYNQIKKFVTSYKVCKYLTWSKYNDDSEIEKYFNKILQKMSFPDETLWIIYNNILIWTIHIILRWDKNIQFWFWILPDFWWKWIWVKSVSLAIDYLKNTIGEWYNIWWDVNNKNIRWIKVLKKSWFQLSQKEIEKDRDRYLFKI